MMVCTELELERDQSTEKLNFIECLAPRKAGSVRVFRVQPKLVPVVLPHN